MRLHILINNIEVDKLYQPVCKIVVNESRFKMLLLELYSVKDPREKIKFGFDLKKAYPKTYVNHPLCVKLWLPIWISLEYLTLSKTFSNFINKGQNVIQLVCKIVVNKSSFKILLLVS